MTLQEETPVPISQYDDEFYPLLQIFKNKNPISILEIGTHHGGTLYHWITKAPNEANIIAIDDQHINIDLYEEWENKRVYTWPLKADSKSEHALDVAKRFPPYDWIFIDGDHSYEGVTSDWENYMPMLNENGIIVFHDITPHSNREVDKFWREVKKYYPTKEIIGSTPWPDQCGIGVVYFDKIQRFA